MTIELRWIVPDCTHTGGPILQWREVKEDAQETIEERPWTRVPVVALNIDDWYDNA